MKCAEGGIRTSCPKALPPPPKRGRNSGSGFSAHPKQIKISHFQRLIFLCAEGGIRTRTRFLPKDFKSFVYTIPPPRHILRPRSDLSPFGGSAVGRHLLRPRSDSHRRILLLQRSALATWLRGHTFFLIILFAVQFLRTFLFSLLRFANYKPRN